MQTELLLKYQIPLFQVADGSGDSGSGTDPGTSAGSGGGTSSTSSPASASPSPASAPSPSASPSPSVTPSPGGAPTPSASPLPSGASVPSGEPSGTPPELDFESIFAPPEEVVLPTQTPVVAPAATPPVAQQPQPAQVQPQPTAPQATQPQAPQQAEQAAVQPSLDPADPIALANVLIQNESGAIDHIAKTMFQLTREEVEALESDTVGTIPKLLAKSFVRSQAMMLQQMGRIVPQMMGRQVEALRKNAMNEGKFYQRWPQLRSHGDLVRRLAVTYRSMNPSATLEHMVEELGPLALMSAKIPLGQAPVQPGVPQPNPTSQPAAGNGVRAPQPSPFVPAVGGPGAASSTNETSPWEAMFSGEE